MDEVAMEPEVTDLATKGVSYSNIAGYRGLVRQERAQALNVDTSIWRSPMLVVGKNKVRATAPSFHGLQYNVLTTLHFSTSLCIPSIRVN